MYSFWKSITSRARRAESLDKVPLPWSRGSAAAESLTRDATLGFQMPIAGEMRADCRRGESLVRGIFQNLEYAKEKRVSTFALTR